MKALALVGWIVVQEAGAGITPANRTTATELRRLARKAGVAYSLEMAGARSRRLGLISGREVFVAA